MVILKNISLITLNYNNVQATINFVKRVANYEIIDHIVVVDNKSTDDSLERLVKIKNKKISVISSGKNGGYGFGNNYGLNYVNNKFKSKYIIISNPDVYFSENVVLKLYDLLNKSSELLIASAVMTDQNGVKQSNTAWRLLPCFTYILNEGALLHRVFKFNNYRNLFMDNRSSVKFVDCLAGSFFMIKQNDIFSNGIYDENMFLYCEEDYLGMKIRNYGYKAALILDEVFIHKHGDTINKIYSVKIEQDKMIFKNELYLMKKYMEASRKMILFAKCFFSICLFERYIYRILFK